jgi:hypothetical protein
VLGGQRAGACVDQLQRRDAVHIPERSACFDQGVEVVEPAYRGDPVRRGRMQPQIQPGDDAQRALGADEQRREVVAGVVAANLAVPVHHRPVGQRHVQAEDLLAHVPVPNTAQPAGVRRRHPTHSGRITRGQVDPEHQTRGGCRSLHLGQCRAGSDVDAPLDGIDLTDVAQPLGRQQHIVMFGHGPRDQRRPAALDSDVRARLAADPQHRGYRVGRSRPHQRAGVPAVAPRVVDTAAVEHIGIGDDVRGAHDPGQRVGQAHRVGVSHGASDKNAPSSTRRSGVDGRYSVSASERTMMLAYLARLTATLRRFRLSRKEMPRGTSSMDDAVIDTNTTGA